MKGRNLLLTFLMGMLLISAALRKVATRLRIFLEMTSQKS